MHPLQLSEIITATGGKLLTPSKNGVVIHQISTDTRVIKQGDLFVALRGDNFDGHNFISKAEKSGARALIVSDPDCLSDRKPRIPTIQVADTTIALGDIARYFRKFIKAKVIAVTGSNGKTTTKEMIHRILSDYGKSIRSPKSFNNFIGVPLTMFSVNPNHQYVVIEVGTNRPGEIHHLAGIVQPDIAVVTNIAPTHLEGLGSLAKIAREKASLLKSLKNSGTAVVEIKNDLLAPHLKNAKYKIVTFNAGRNKAIVWGNSLKIKPDGIEFTVNGKHRCFIPILGSWNMANALAAIAAVYSLGFSIKEAIKPLKDFRLPPMRMEKEVFAGVTFINDAYNANPQSVMRLLDDIKLMKTSGRKILVLGEMRELGKYSAQYHKEVGDKIAESGVDALFAIGQETHITIQRVYYQLHPITAFYFASASDAGNYLGGYLKKGDLVVLKGSRAIGLEEALRRAKLVLAVR